MDQDPPDHQVGYGKPPKKHRFVKGQSGNPQGRPKGSKNKSSLLPSGLNPFDEVLCKSFEKPLTVVNKGTPDEVAALQVVLDKIIVEAAKGNFRSQKLVVELAKSWGSKTETEKSSRLNFMATYKREWDPIFDAAQKRGVPEPRQLPHPAHVQLLPGEFDVAVMGPLNLPDKKAWDALKSHLRSIDDALEYSRRQMGTRHETAELPKEILRLEKLLRDEARAVPDGWDWRENVTDFDRPFYRGSPESK